MRIKSEWIQFISMILVLAGIIGASAQTIGVMNSRIDHLEDTMIKGFERIDRRFEKIDERFEKLEEKLDKLSESVHNHNTRITVLEDAPKKRP